MIKVNGVEIPTPSDLSVGIQDISKAERNARGTLIIERITTKRKLEMTWSYLTKEQLQQLFTAVSPVLFTVEYPDPVTNTVLTGTFYAGDRKSGALDYRNGNIRWKDCGFNVIER